MGLWDRLRGRRAQGPVESSPVPWLSDPVWSAWPHEPGKKWRCPVERPWVLAVWDSDRERAPRWPVPEGATVPEPGSVADNTALLATTPGTGRGTRSPVWPVCCERLSTLIWNEGVGPSIPEIEAAVGPLDRAYLEQEVLTEWGPPEHAPALLEQGFGPTLERIRRGKLDKSGVNLFQCRSCGRLYLASCKP